MRDIDWSLSANEEAREEKGQKEKSGLDVAFEASRMEDRDGSGLINGSLEWNPPKVWMRVTGIDSKLAASSLPGVGSCGGYGWEGQKR